MNSFGFRLVFFPALALFIAGWAVLSQPRKPAQSPPYIAGTVYNPADSFTPAPFPEVSDMPDYATPYLPNPQLSYVPSTEEKDENMNGMPDAMEAAIEDPEINCIALTVFIEARGESTLGQALVASSVVNRARSLGIDECSVVSASGQYHSTLSADPWMIDADSWSRSVEIARIVRSDEYDLASCRGVTHFHAHSVTPHWASKLNYACKVDGHTYYRMPQ